MPSPNLLDSATYLELAVLETGREICIADKRIQFTPKEYPLIHYVYSGKGKFSFRGKTYSIKAGDCFLIPSGEDAAYYPAEDNPWSYFWIGLGGSKAASLLEFAGLTPQSPIVHDRRKCWRAHFEGVYQSYFRSGTFGLDALGQTYLLLGEMVTDNRAIVVPDATEKGHIQAAKAFIRNNFQFPISILDVAYSVGVSPNYLANLFAKEGEISPKRYLIQIRMETAANLLRTSSSSITDVAKAVGYTSPLHFSKSFSAYYGVSPLHYRKQGEN